MSALLGQKVMFMPELFVLVTEAQQGNKEAMEKVINLCMPLIIRYCKDEKHRINEDCKQFLIVRVIRAIKRFQLL